VAADRNGAGDWVEQRISVARDCIEALNQRDFDAYFACVTSDFVLTTGPLDPGQRVSVTRTQLRRFFESFLGDYDNVRYEFLEGPEPIGDRLFSRDRWSGTDRDGIRRSTEVYAVASFRGTLASRVDLFVDEESARRFARFGEPAAAVSA
jgi:SnoaL-like protein